MVFNLVMVDVVLGPRSHIAWMPLIHMMRVEIPRRLLMLEFRVVILVMCLILP